MISKIDNKEVGFKEIANIVSQNGFTVEETDNQRPWGGFVRLSNDDSERFIDLYFKQESKQFKSYKNLSPKYLLVGPGKPLSWQYHYKRAEYWKVLYGQAGVKLGDTDNLPKDTKILNTGDYIKFKELVRHRLIGLEDWAIVVEIWEHIDPLAPSSEEDIVRVADDFGR